MAKGKKTGGRQKGVPNKATPEIQELARQVTTGNPTYWANLKERLEEGKASPAVEAAMLAYAHGRPPETMKHVGPDGGAIQINHHFSA